ncbi:hypothetical protein AVEN_117178-1 [Araneus ventricosus]|uniref:Uncharacterized protein n=1 Tax=Araneus ventricosus TaxID=182803 RepID=A0A4Y2AWI2_ARAVE|nr:hypothetical protein AVEN_117178-1 [Araneus ventricosus]
MLYKNNIEREEKYQEITFNESDTDDEDTKDTHEEQESTESGEVIQKISPTKYDMYQQNLGPRCEASGKIKDPPTSAPLDEGRDETRIPRMGEEEYGWVEFCDFESCLKTNFGRSMNALPNFSTEMGGEKTSLRTNGISRLHVNSQL